MNKHIIIKLLNQPRITDTLKMKQLKCSEFFTPHASGPISFNIHLWF